METTMPQARFAPAKFSVEDYHQMVESGMLAHRHVELLDGLIVEMPPEKPNIAITERTSHGLPCDVRSVSSRIWLIS